MKVKLLVAVFSAVLCFSTVQPITYAETTTSAVSQVEPYYAVNATADTDLTIQGNTATCYSSIQAEDTVKITAEQTLQKQGFLWIWGGVSGDSWTKTVSSTNMLMSNTASGLDSGLYRLKTVFTLTLSSGKTEKITVYSNEQRVP